MDVLEKKVSNYFQQFGVTVINLVIERHQISDRKRGLFTLRFVSEDDEEQKKLTEEMNQLTKRINEMDSQLEKIGVSSKLRTQIIRDIKKCYPNGRWTSGFSEEGSW